MDVEVLRDGKRYNLHFEKGENIGGLKARPYTGRQTGTRIRWKPDLEVFTDMAVPQGVLHRCPGQAVVNPGVVALRDQAKGFAEETFCYQNGIPDLRGAGGESPPMQCWTGSAPAATADKEDYRVKLGVALCFQPGQYHRVCPQFRTSWSTALARCRQGSAGQSDRRLAQK